MGLFDSIYAPCAHCGAPLEFQTKAGDCQMDRFEIDTAPAYLLWDVKDDPKHCIKCDGWTALIDPAIPPGPQPPPDLRAARVQAPESPQTHPQGWKWWPLKKVFTFDDLMDRPDEAGRAALQDEG
jgi:hypothetical protein